MTLSEAIVDRLLALMKQRGFSQYDFYRKGGIAKSTVSQILNGTRKKGIAVATIYEMCQTMGVTLAEFFNDPVFDEVID